jgi:phosphoribosylglycinamide formyltransferase-1
MSNIAIFASGSGTNAEKIMTHFKDHPTHQVKMVFSNKKDAGVLEKANKYGVECFVFNRKDLYETSVVLDTLKKNEIDFIVLAGFLWLMPNHITRAYDRNIVNIHPALLPKYGGKGMYGMNVHRAVIEANDKKSGITIHWVNENYDEGDIIFQTTCDIDPEDTDISLAEKVHQLEYRHFPVIIEQLLDQQS